MHTLASLWLPTLLSAVVVFVISSLVHMAFKWHAREYRMFSNEDAVRDAIRAGSPAPGRYVIPQCREMKDMATEAMKKKYAEGPVGHVTIIANGQPNMGKYLGQWFLLCLLVSAVAALLAGKVYGGYHAFAGAAAKLAFAVSFVGYGFGTLQESIWMGRPWSGSALYLLDAALYALGTAAVFWWLWP
ncbi:MAG TPA: hypothetical protein VMB21_19065 [Candidatus Limnocylindria bacterium]|jgi:hypothetical protein|nr:hypothetical protein [Candidatus Limnocylindria bacterium]HTL69290.1 hypothetical protein [Lacunisphaera sp.]